MALEQTKTPYEFLARWDDAGKFKGAHIVFIERIMDGTTVVATKYGDAMSVAVAGNEGFPLSDVLADLQSSAIASADDKAAQLTQLTADKKASDDATAKAVGERDAAIAQMQTLQGQLDALKTPVDANGVPKSVPMEKAQRIMLRTPLAGATLLDAVQAAVDKMAASGTLEGREAQIIWEKSNAVERTNPLLKEMQAVLGLSDAQIDGLFVAAEALS